MKKIEIGELNESIIIAAIETCRKTTLELTRLQKLNILSPDIETEFDYVFDGLWDLLYMLYPIEAISGSKFGTVNESNYNKLYDEFIEYLGDDTKSLDDVFKMIEETEIQED